MQMQFNWDGSSIIISMCRPIDFFKLKTFGNVFSAFLSLYWCYILEHIKINDDVEFMSKYIN